MAMSLLDMHEAAAAKPSMTKAKLSEIMGDPNSTEEERIEAVRLMNEAGGYDNLADD